MIVALKYWREAVAGALLAACLTLFGFWRAEVAMVASLRSQVQAGRNLAASWETVAGMCSEKTAQAAADRDTFEEKYLELAAREPEVVTKTVTVNHVIEREVSAASDCESALTSIAVAIQQGGFE